MQAQFTETARNTNIDRMTINGAEYKIHSFQGEVNNHEKYFATGSKGALYVIFVGASMIEVRGISHRKTIHQMKSNVKINFVPFN